MNNDTKNISINSGSTVISVNKTITLAEALQGEGIYLPSACGGRGLCGRCKCKVLTPAGEPNERELKKLSADEISQGYRLACQLEVTGDIEIELPQELLDIRRYEGIVENIEPLTYDIRKIHIKLVKPATINFVPGRFVQLEIPAYDNSEKPVRRAYSLASSPEADGYIELIIRRVPGGKSTTWIFDHLTEGQAISFSGPFGEFGMTDTAKPMIWIAGGSGMGPFLSMLEHCRTTGNTRDVMFFYGACTEKDLFYVERLAELQEQLDWFTFIPALSEPSEKWQGAAGLITEVVREYVPDNSPAEGYLCGSPGMCEAACKVLNEKGIPTEHIYYDKFIGQESLETACMDGRTVSWNPGKN